MILFCTFVKELSQFYLMRIIVCVVIKALDTRSRLVLKTHSNHIPNPIKTPRMNYIQYYQHLIIKTNTNIKESSVNSLDTSIVEI